MSNDDDNTSTGRSVAVPLRIAVGIAVAIVALGAVLLVVVMGGGGDDDGNSANSLNPLQARARELRANKQKLVDGKAFLPPSRSHILAVLERQGPGAIDRASARINRYAELPDVPHADLFGAPTGDEPRHWFNVVYCDNGGISSWAVNPYTVNAFQASITVNSVDPPCGSTSQPAPVPEAAPPEASAGGAESSPNASRSVDFPGSKDCSDDLAVKGLTCSEAKRIRDALGPVGNEIGAKGFVCTQVAGDHVGGVLRCANGDREFRTAFSE